MIAHGRGIIKGVVRDIPKNKSPNHVVEADHEAQEEMVVPRVQSGLVSDAGRIGCQKIPRSPGCVQTLRHFRVFVHIGISK